MTSELNSITSRASRKSQGFYFVQADSEDFDTLGLFLGGGYARYSCGYYQGHLNLELVPRDHTPRGAEANRQWHAEMALGLTILD